MTQRLFDTGANRNPDTDKPDYEGFLDPATLQAYAAYMHHHRKLDDGTLRASDNWQKGIPTEQYVKSLLRHVMDVWLDNRGQATQGGLAAALGGILFNAFGLLSNTLKANPDAMVEDLEIAEAARQKMAREKLKEEPAVVEEGPVLSEKPSHLPRIVITKSAGDRAGPPIGSSGVQVDGELLQLDNWLGGHGPDKNQWYLEPKFWSYA